MNVTSDEAVRELFNPEDEKKIIKIEKWGQSNKVVVFKDIEERDAVLAALPEDVKSRNGEDRSRPLVKIFQQRDNNNKSYGPTRGGAGAWGSSRGGNANAAQGGYRSGGASDSEGGRGGRGRGGPRGGRGGERGPRGGRGQGRGSFNKADGSPAPASATPASGDA